MSDAHDILNTAAELRGRADRLREIVTTLAATPIPTRRSMECGRCGAEWSVPNLPLPVRAVHCPYCEAHICGCGCGADLRSKRTDALYESEAHAKRLQRAVSADIPPTKTVADARALQEDAKAHWSMVVDEAIVRHFRRRPTGIFHADDLESVGIPDDHRNVIGSQIAKWVNRRRMVECGRRASTVPSRNGAKSNEYRLTERGRDLVAAGLDSGGAFEGSAAVEPGENVGAGQANGKRDHGGFVSSASAGTDTSDHDIHAGVLPSSSPYSSENEYS